MGSAGVLNQSLCQLPLIIFHKTAKEQETTEHRTPKEKLQFFLFSSHGVSIVAAVALDMDPESMQALDQAKLNTVHQYKSHPWMYVSVTAKYKFILEHSCLSLVSVRRERSRRDLVDRRSAGSSRLAAINPFELEIRIHRFVERVAEGHSKNQDVNGAGWTRGIQNQPRRMHGHFRSSPWCH